MSQSKPSGLTKRETELLECALNYRDLGWSVIPIKPDGSKRSAVLWTKYQTELPSKEEIFNWFTGMYRGYNIGVVTGKVSQVWVLDLDNKDHENGLESFAALEKQFGVASDTLSSVTGGGGKHYFYYYDEPISNSSGSIGSGIDVRGNGGYVLVPPSTHQSGTNYSWDTDPMEHDPQTAPYWLSDFAICGRNMTKSVSTPTPTQSFTDFGKLIDGREKYMAAMVFATIKNLSANKNRIPTEDEVFDDAWPMYESKVATRGESLEAEGRGETAMREKIRYTLKKFASDYDPQHFSKPEPIKKKSPITIIKWAELQTSSVSWLVDNILPANSFAALYGAPGTFKSFVAMYLSSAIASGTEFMGKECVQGSVVYVAGEGGHGLKARKDALFWKYNLDYDLPVYFIKQQLDLRNGSSVEPLFDAITALNIKPSLVIIDTLARAFSGGNENSSEDMGGFIQHCGVLQQRLETSVLVVHHSGKDKAQGLRGHSSLLGAVDTELETSRLGKEENRLGKVAITKQKDGEDNVVYGFKAHRIATSILDNSLVVEPCDIDDIQEKKKLRLGANESICLEQIKRAIAYAQESQWVCPIPYAPKGKACKYSSAMLFMTEVMPQKEKKVRDQAIARALSSLISKNIIHKGGSGEMESVWLL